MKSIQKPFLKWVGGKSQIIEHVIEKIPKNIQNYHEPFVGGGSVLFAILSLNKIGIIHISGTVYAYDYNQDLIQLYKNIQNNYEELYDNIDSLLKEYDSLSDIIENDVNRNPTTIDEAKLCKENLYYWYRKKYNSLDVNNIQKSALFIFLNKTCFRGLFREGPNGFNVPYGHYKTTPQFISKDEFGKISNLIKDVIFIHSSYETSLINPIEGDFVYLDPPYVPESSVSFVSYTNKGFDKKDHKRLFDMIIELHRKNIKFMLSNSSVDMVIETFKDFNCENVTVRRAINSKNPNSTTKEIIIFNYEVYL